MCTVEEIEAAIAKLPEDEFWKLTDRLIALREDEWDRQIESDAKTGKLDKLWEKAKTDIETGRVKPLDEFLDNE
ncbi:MAG: hypothetical protein O2960_21455 [Verrucomicrobia bacterium]|nr:hypothetical protein [Verrucomicrobiota bacterium]